MEYEIHVTVKTSIKAIEAFKSTCKEIHVKPIVIEVSNFIAGGGDKKIQVMTSSKHDSVYSGDYNSKLTEICDALKVYGYEILRKKVEIKPEKKTTREFLLL